MDGFVEMTRPQMISVGIDAPVFVNQLVEMTPARDSAATDVVMMANQESQTDIPTGADVVMTANEESQTDIPIFDEQAVARVSNELQSNYETVLQALRQQNDIAANELSLVQQRLQAAEIDHGAISQNAANIQNQLNALQINQARTLLGLRRYIEERTNVVVNLNVNPETFQGQIDEILTTMMTGFDAMRRDLIRENDNLRQAVRHEQQQVSEALLNYTLLENWYRERVAEITPIYDANLAPPPSYTPPPNSPASSRRSSSSGSKGSPPPSPAVVEAAVRSRRNSMQQQIEQNDRMIEQIEQLPSVLGRRQRRRSSLGDSEVARQRPRLSTEEVQDIVMEVAQSVRQTRRMANIARRIRMTADRQIAAQTNLTLEGRTRAEQRNLRPRRQRQ